MDARVEAKLGFDKVRAAIEARCSTEYAAARVAEEEFCTDAAQIHRRHLLADEMRLILMFEDSFPTAGYIDAIAFLEPIGKSASIDLLSLGKLRTLLDTLRKALHFFHTVKEGIYPNLQHLAAGIQAPVEVMRRIDAILDCHGDIKDTASDELYKIRRSIKDKELNMSKRMNAILREAQQAGLADAEASVAIRDGKMLIPVTSAKKRAFQGFVYDESATGKTTFMEPAEIVALQNEIAELHFAQTREIAKILYEFAEFLRPFVPELIAGATFVGELDFNMAKAYVRRPAWPSQGPAPAAGKEPAEREKSHCPAHRGAHPGKAHSPHLRSQRRRQERLPQNRGPAAVHVPVGYAHPYVGKLGTACVRPHYGLYRGRPIPGKRPFYLQQFPCRYERHARRGR